MAICERKVCRDIWSLARSNYLKLLQTSSTSINDSALSESVKAGSSCVGIRTHSFKVDPVANT